MFTQLVQIPLFLIVLLLECARVAVPFCLGNEHDVNCYNIRTAIILILEVLYCTVMICLDAYITCSVSRTLSAPREHRGRLLRSTWIPYSLPEQRSMNQSNFVAGRSSRSVENLGNKIMKKKLTNIPSGIISKIPSVLHLVGWSKATRMSGFHSIHLKRRKFYFHFNFFKKIKIF